MATTKLTFGEWMPDQPGISGALNDAKNVVSQAIGYGPLPTAAIFSAAASENLNNVFAGKFSATTNISEKLHFVANASSAVGTEVRQIFTHLCSIDSCEFCKLFT